jgi:ribosomal protein S18 acetylase RimI-like enzyme
MENIFEKLTLRFPETEAEMKSVMQAQSSVFGDKYDFYDDFYVWAGKDCVLAAFDGEEPVGAVSFPQITYPTKEKTLVGGYIFAAWVAPAYRGSGIFRALMAKAEQTMRERGYDFSFVVPADKELFALYENLGYNVPAENGFPYRTTRDTLREYNPTDDIYMLWKVYSRVHDMPAKDIEFFNHTMRVMEEEGKFFAISKRGYIVYTPCFDEGNIAAIDITRTPVGFLSRSPRFNDNTIEVYDRMEKGSLVDGGKREVRGLCKFYTEEKPFEKTVFNGFFEPVYGIIKN